MNQKHFYEDKQTTEDIGRRHPGSHSSWNDPTNVRPVSWCIQKPHLHGRKWKPTATDKSNEHNLRT